MKGKINNVNTYWLFSYWKL